MLALPRPVILASQSPRRRALLKQIGLAHSVQPSGIVEENMPLDMPPAQYATELARLKAEDIARQQSAPSLVIGADTIVVHRGKILNKPSNREEARSMLRLLSGDTHTVFTGVAIVLAPELKSNCAAQKTDVLFRELDDIEISEYVDSGSPLDKAGAYGIQDDFGAVFVKHIVGCYYNIVGLPLEMVYRMLKEVIF